MYYSLNDIKAFVVDKTYVLTPYVSTKTSLFTFALNDSGVSMTGYSGTDSTVILPRYALVGSNYHIVTELGGEGNLFTGNTSVTTVVLNEGLVSIASVAFKNCSSLKNVYFSKTVQNVAGDAFFLDSGKNYEANRDIAQNRRFYIPTGSGLSTSKWAAAKHTTSGTHYYGNSGRYLLVNKYDYSKAFQTNSYTAFTKSLEIAKSL